MAGWGGAEGPETPITGREEAGRGRAIGMRASGDPPTCVTSLSSANFQATGWGRGETLGGVPGSCTTSRVVLPRLEQVAAVPGEGPPGHMGLEGEQDSGSGEIGPQSPGFCKQECSASVGIPKLWGWGELL